MKKPTFSKAVFAVFILLLSFTSVAQTYKTFSIRKKIDIRGKMIVAGNNILGKDNFSFNDDKLANQNIDMKYIDIDADGSTFSSSSADLVVPNKVVNGTPTSIPTSCYRVAYAALYWGALLQSGSRSDINKVKLKLPGAVSYNDISGTIVYDAGSSGSGIDSKPGELPNKPYACYADVTSLLSTLSNINGTYTVANVISSEGSNGSTGLSAGWTLFVVYEDPSLNMKSFNVFDGFSQIFNTKVEDVPVTGFITPQAGNVDLQFAYAALDGDKTIGATKLEFESHQVVTPLRPANEFFNASIENTNGVSTPRNPSGSNTLGYDTGVLEVKGAEPEYIRNNQTSTSFALQVANGKADPVFAFFGAYAVDIIAPKIDLTKIVKNTSGVDIGGGNVNLAQSLVYEISYQSTGNDNVKNFTIKDVLPQNLVFNPATGIDYTNAGGATLQSYDAATRTLIFNIPSTSVTVNGGLYTIGLKVQVAPDCNSLATACSNEIKNQAFATYQGVINTNVVKEEGSYASTVCKLGSPESTNFIVDISNCKFTKNVILCGSSVVLKASDGYTNYSWSRNPDGSSPIGTGQTFTATQTGIYYVHNTAPLTCKDIVEEITVTHFGVTNTNPVIPFADQLVTCANDGKVLPNIFLCGANATRSIKTGISDAASIVWEKLDEIICPSTAIANCANENFANSCWKQVGTGPDYLANTQGQFRVTLNYSGGCFSIFYFNVYQNLLDPTYTKKDIVCTTPGKITIVGVPSGYEFSLDGVNYQLNNPEFIITTAGSYTVYIKQQGVTTNPCIFQVPNILINNRTMNVRTFVTQPSCNGINDGSIKLIAENVEPQYYFSIEKGGALINSVVPTATNEHTFANLSPGSYTVKVSTDDNCTYTATVDIINPPLIKVTANVTKPITCIDGEITINIEGGTPNYNYYVNGTDVLLNSTLTSFAVPVSTAGTYDIKVDDLNNCPAVTSVPVSAIPAPVYTVTSTNILCYGSGTGEIQFNVTNANGYTLAYSIDNGVTYLPTPTFSNLAAGTYNTIVRYTLGTSVCYGAMQAITITEPNSAVTASAGVSELAGCTLSGQGGKLRITNPQGGVAPYLYSFDNQATWVTTNEADMLPGTYTLYVKDANGCIYPMPNVVLDPKPVAPTIDVSSPVFNCNGTANSTVTVTNSGSASYQYDYLLDGTANTNVPSNVFVNVPTGSHTVSVTYKLLTVPTYSNLLFEDFGKGAPTTTPGINPAYCFEDQHFPNGNCNGGRDLVNNEYSVTSKIQIPWSGWVQNIRDTTVPLDPNGRFLAIDIGSAAGPGGILYSKTIKDIIPNKDILVDFNAINLYQAKYSSKADPNLKIELVYDLGKPTEYKVPNSNPNSFNVPKTEAWIPYKVTLNPGAYTTLSFVIRSNSTQYDGNDVGIDDIRVYQLPTSCLSQVDFPFEVPTGKAFTGSVTGFKDITCAGANNGEITIAVQNFDTTAGFQYSIDGGSTWQTSTISPVTIKNLVAGTYTPQLRYNAAGACPLTLSPVTIKQPTPLTVTATVTTQATCTTGASITAVANGGTPAYQYELRQSNGVTVVTAFNANAVFTNVAAGNYSIFAKDANGCITSIGAAVNVVAPPVLTATLDPTSDLCYDTVNQATLKVTITGGTSPFVYSLDGAAAQNTNTFTNVGFGTHNILVTDSKNCTATIANIVIAKQLLASAVVSKPLDCTTSPNAKIDVTITDGTAPYTYKVKLGSGSYGTSTNVTGNTFTYSTATVGTYTFEITDAKGCQAYTTATINGITNPTATATPTDPTCNNGTDGQVQIIGAGGSGGFAYSLNGGAFGATSLYTGLNANTTTANTTVYTYQVRDSKQCLSPVYSVTLNNPTKVVAAATIPANTACGTSTVVTVTASGGAGGYTYSFNGSSTYTGVNTLPVTYTNAIQTVTYSVKDSKGCIDTKTISIPAFNPPSGIAFSPGAAITCNATTTSITLTSVGGIAPLTYTIVSGPTTNATGATSGTFTGLAPGNYVFEVKDANGCTKQASTTINPAPVISVAGVKTDVKCFGATDGTATFTITGASSSGNFTYTLTPNVGTVTQSGNTVTVTGLGANTYSLVVKDNATGCSSNTASVIVNPATQITFSAVGTNINCNNKLSTISFSTPVSGGTPGYTYAYVTAGSTAPAAGVYSTSTTVDTAVLTTSIDVYVKDTNGCFEKRTITINTDPTPSVTASVSNQCLGTGSNFTITATGAGGTGTRTYGINGATGAFQSGNTFNVAPGTYTVWVKDANGCTASAVAPITVSPQLTSSSAVTKALDCFTVGANATITTTISGGRANHSYVITNAGGTTVASGTGVSGTTITYTGAAADTYTVTVTDANTCVTTSTVTVNPISNPTVIATPTNPLCNGGTGSVTLTGAGGSGGYTYSNNATTGFTTNATFTGLSASATAYTFYVKDSKGCTGSVNVTITQPTQLDATVAEVGFSCSPTNTNVAGTVTINVTVGTGTTPYTYSFNGSGFTGNNVLTLNDNGTDQPYTYQVRDANGCIISGSGTLERLNPPVITLIAGSTITCNATASTVTVTATNGVGGLQYETIAPSPIIVAKQNSNSFANLTPGDYIFRVTDANGCYATQSYRVNDKIQVTAVGNKLTDVACNGGNTGSARFTVGNAVGTITVQLLNSSNIATGIVSVSGSTYTYTGLTVGNYIFTVTDAGTGCTATVPVSIVEPTAVLSANLVSNVNANCKTPFAVVTVTAAGGTPNYSYAFVHDGVTPTASDYVSGSTTYSAHLDPTAATAWDVWVKDSQGCTITAPIDVIITTDGVPDLSLLVNNQCSASGNTFQIEATNTVGVAPFTYTINTGVAPTGTNNNIFTVAAGTYQVTVTDANGCTDTESIVVSPAMNPVATLVKDITCHTGNESAQISVVINGGMQNFTYAVSYNGAPYVGTNNLTGNTFTYSTNTAGTYSFEITDANGCKKVTNTRTVTAPVLVAGNAAPVNPTCNGFNDGAVTLTATAGEGPFEYSFNGSLFGPANVFGGLAAGTYNYVIRDAKGCDFSDSVTLTDPAAILPVIKLNDIKCNTADVPGSIQINGITGGIAPFTFTLFNASHAVLHTGTVGTAPTVATPYIFPNALNFGDYYVTVVDSKGCEYTSDKLRINTIPYLTFLPPSISGTCKLGATVDLSLDTTNYPSAPNYIYSIYGDPSSAQAPTTSTTAQFTGLNFGQTYYFQVIDGNLCTSIIEVKIDPLSLIKIDPITTTNVTCNTSPVTANGTVNFTVSDFGAGTTSIKLELLDPLTNMPLPTPLVKSPIDITSVTSISESFTGLGAGSYTLMVTELDGTECTASVQFEIKQPAQPLDVAVASNVNATCNKLAQVRVTATGGTGPFTYSAASGSTTVTSATNVLNLDYDAGTNWTITVTDANGCTDTVPVVIGKDSEPVITLSVVDKCVTEDTFEISVSQVTAGVGVYSISVDDSTFMPIVGLPYPVSGLHSGQHKIIIKDANDCKNEQTIIIAAPLLATPAITALPTCNNDDGVITMSGTGGTGSYTYSISPSPMGVSINQTTGVISGLPAGTFTVTMTDTATPTNCSTTASVTLSAPTPVTFTTSTTAPLCPTDANGTITVILDAANNNPNYTYEITAGPTTRAAQSINVFTGLAAGTYTVRVNSGRGCFDTAIVPILDPLPVVASAILTKGLTCGTANSTNKAEITASASGGAGGYTYGTDGTNFSSQTVFETYTAGAFTIYAKDANGCIDSETINIPALDPPTQMDIAGTPIYCVQQGLGDVTSTVTISNVIDGVGPFSYAILAPLSATGNTTGASNGIFTGLAPDTYLFQVTDANGCTYQESYTVDPVNNITVAATSTTDVNCFGNNNGSAVFKVANFAATYSAVLTAGTGTPVIAADTVTLSSLSPGAYTLRVTDATTGCTADVNFAIAEPSALSLSEVSNINANCNSGAKVTVLATGGTPNYTYAFVANNATPLATDYTASASAVLPFTAPAPNNYDVWVKDANGCTFKLDVEINVDASPAIVMPASQCYVGTPFNIDLSVGQTVSKLPATYTINGSNQTSSIYTIKAPGTYQLSIVDANGCPSNIVNYVVQPQLILAAALTQNLTCVVNASIALTATGGVSPYVTYEVNDGSGYIVASNPFTTAVAGTYKFRVTDTQGCQAESQDVIVNTPTTPTFTTVKTNVSCIGGSNGSITVTPANGIAPYTFALTGPVTNNTGDTTGIYTGLIAGSYNVVVTDAYGCTSLAAAAIDITEPPLLTANHSVPANTTCSVATVITVVGNGGTPTVSGGYYYNFNNLGYDTTNTFTVNDNGAIQTITYTVKDANGCETAPQSVIINPLNKPINLDFALTTAPTCPSPTATVTLTATNGAGTLSYAILAPASATGNISGASNGVFTGLAPDTYTFQVTDANGCTYQELYKVDPVTNITVSGQLIANMSCNVGDDGKVTFDVSNFSGNYTYTITKDGVSFVPSTSSSSATIPLTGLGFGVYKIDVTDSTTLCTSTVSVTVAQPSVVTVAEVSNTAANCTSNALVKVAGSGGTPGYTYAYRVSGSSTALVFSASDTASLDPALGTVWDFYAKDINGCISAPLTVNISTDPLPSGFSATATSLCPNTAGTFDITVNVGSGMGPFEYSIGSGFQSSTLFTVNVPKAYDLIVKDKFGCTATFTAVVTLLEPIALQTNITALPSCANNDGTITASATGGSGNYSYQLDGGTAINAPTANFTGLASGSHTIMVTDLNNGCSDSVILNLVPATQVTGFNLNATNVTCNGGNDGTITATMTTPAPGVNDNPIYTYTLSGTDSNGPVNVGPQQGNMFNNLRAGSYTVTVTSGRGCSATLSVPVTEPGVITVPTPTVAPFGCTSGSNAMNFATITVNGVTGGSGTDYNYEFFRNGMPVQRGASNVYTEADFAGGNYSVTVYDSNGCAGSNLTPLIIAPFTPMDKIDVVVNQAINCTNPENITVTAVDASGVAIAGVQYTIEGKDGITGAIVYPAQTNTTGVFTGLSVANYIITATNPATGCSIQDVHYVSEPNTFDLTIDNIVDVTCFGGANGSANVTLIDRVPLPTNEAGPFTYTLKDALGNSLPGGSSTATGTLALTNLAAGTYTITATLIGSPYCSVSKVFTINRPTAALNINTTHTEITCVAGNNDGTITASATGGWPGGYQFQLVGPVNVAYSAQTNFTGLTAGSYTLNVRDSKGCVATTTVNLSNPTPIVFTVSPSATTLSCFGDRSASITASMPTGGQGSNYLYTLNTTSLVPATSNGPQTSSVFNGLGAGTYTITVTDGYSCSATSAPITISEPAKVIASLIVASTQTCTTQTRLTLSANGGTSPYTYSSDGTTYGASFASSVSINVSPGTYHYYVKDANGCVSSVSNDIKIDPLVPLTINLDKLNPVINCAGDSNGVITADAQGGLGNYVYTLTNVDSGVATAPQSSGVFNGLIAGNYKVHVDSGDCTEEVLVTITQPTSVLTASAATIPVTCSGNGDGKIVITASGGTGEIRYAISPNSDQFFVGNIAGGHSFNNLKPGFYTIIAQDQNGCFHLETVEITEPTPLTSIVDALSIKQELCAGERTGEFTIGITGGTAPYSTSIDGDAFVLDRVSFTGLSGGKHTVIVKDANLCEFTLDELLNPAVTLDPQELVSNDCVNDLPANKVTVTVDPSNIPSDVTYSLDSSGVWQNSNVFTNLTPGNHFVMVQHKNGCVDATNPFTIDQVDPLTISIDLGGLNEIVATVTGGSGVYQFTVNGESIGSNNKYIYFHSGNYTVTVTDSYGCSLSTTKYFEFIDITIPPIFTPNGDGTSDNWKPTNTENYPDIKFIVYDRYGRQVGVFGAGQSWDGKYNGTELPMGDYWYILKLRHRQDDREFVGHFTLYR